MMDLRPFVLDIRNHRTRGDLLAAADICRRALAARPNHDGLWSEFLDLLHELGDFQAIDRLHQSFGRILLNRPGFRGLFLRSFTAMLDAETRPDWRERIMRTINNELRPAGDDRIDLNDAMFSPRFYHQAGHSDRAAKICHRYWERLKTSRSFVAMTGRCAAAAGDVKLAVQALKVLLRQGLAPGSHDVQHIAVGLAESLANRGYLQAAGRLYLWQEEAAGDGSARWRRGLTQLLLAHKPGRRRARSLRFREPPPNLHELESAILGPDYRVRNVREFDQEALRLIDPKIMPSDLDPLTALSTSRIMIAANRPDEALNRLGVLHTPLADLLRGDAYALQGKQRTAREAYAQGVRNDGFFAGLLEAAKGMLSDPQADPPKEILYNCQRSALVQGEVVPSTAELFDYLGSFDFPTYLATHNRFATDSWFALSPPEWSCLFSHAHKADGPIVEVGRGRGANLWLLLLASNPDLPIVSLDPEPFNDALLTAILEQTELAGRARLVSTIDHVDRHLPPPDLLVYHANLYRGGQLDFQNAKDMMELWYPQLRPGASVLIHDGQPGSPVRYGALDALKSYGADIVQAPEINVENPNGTFIIARKPRDAAGP